jgi:hypothetical protein
MGHVPFCQQVADELASQGGPRTVVVGLDGETAVTDQAGETWAKDVPQSSYPNWSEFTNNFGTEYQNLNTAAKSLPSDTERELRDNAAKLAGLSSKIFAWVYKDNAKHVQQRPGGLKDPRAKTYGIPGQII